MNNNNLLVNLDDNKTLTESFKMGFKDQLLIYIEKLDSHQQNKFFQLLQNYEINNKQDLDLITEQNNIIYNLRAELGKTREPLLKIRNKSNRDPITPEIYQLILDEISEINYIGIRLRLAFCLLLITKLQIKYLLSLKMNQLKNLLDFGWMTIKVKSSNQMDEHKIFLTIKEQEILKNQRKDIERFLQWKEPDAFIFTSDSNHFKQLNRESFTRSLNQILHQVSEKLPDKLNLTSHSFRITDTSEF